MLWIQPVGHENKNAVRLGISNLEFIPTKYKLQAMADNQIIQEWSDIQLTPGERWEVTITIPLHSSQISTVEALLYRLDAPDVIYRRATLQREP